ncbi:MAG: hypothetical protein K2L18_04960 [Acetatifactor sp.]|nr:hypothetical protein [Acetatifactor sp.]
MKNLKEKLKGEGYGIRTAFGLLLCVTLFGCSGVAEESAESAEADLAETGLGIGKGRPDHLAEPSLGIEETRECSLTVLSELTEPYQQMAMYIQEGFRTYQVEGNYQMYFGPIEDGGGSLWVEGKYLGASEKKDREFSFCNILLENEGTWWREELAYEYDAEADWYVFAGQYEPVFSKAPFEAEFENSSYVEELLKNYVYEISVARDADVVAPIRYTSENGPVQWDHRVYYPGTFGKEEEKEHDYFVAPMTYTYWDERLDIDIAIEYVQVMLHDGQEELEETINEKLREAFFYDDWDGWLEPGQEIYSVINKFYKITREDEKYLSMRIYEYGDRRGCAHPGEGETGITIDMQTGEVVRLEDVVGKEYTPQLLIESGAFRCMWGWMGDDDDDWIEELKEEGMGDDLSRYDDRFYLTDTGVGLITYLPGNEYTNLEAAYEDLGLEGF